MGSSADARLAWGVALVVPDDYYKDDKHFDPFDLDEWEEEHEYNWLDTLFEYDFDRDGPRYEGLDRNSPEWDMEYAAFRQRHDTMVPVAIHGSGVDDYRTSFVLLERNSWAYDYGYEEVEPETLREPSETELAAIQKVLDHISFKGNRDVKLYLIASYG
jgi:hypothetical protein